MKHLIARLRKRSGETLVESLAAILVFTLSSLLLFSMVNTANRINEDTKKADQERQSQLVVAESGESSRTSTVYLYTGDSGSIPESFTVYVAQKEQEGDAPPALYSYFRAVQRTETEP